MASNGAGYFASGFFATGYWHDGYWPESGAAAAITRWLIMLTDITTIKVERG